MSIEQLTIGLEKCRVTLNCLVKKLNRLPQVLLKSRAETCREEKSLGPGVKVEGGQVGGGRFFDRRFLVRRKLGLQLIGDGFGNLALDGKDIGQIAIISLRPEMRVGPRIDQLRVHPHLFAARCTLPSSKCATPSCCPISRRLRCEASSCTASH